MVNNSIAWVRGLLLMGFFFICSCKKGERAASNDLPNIVIILADDLGYGDLGSYNTESLIPTPHLDRLASEGIRLTDAYCPVAVCSPSRFALMTGSYPWRSWNKHGVLGNYEPSMMDEGQLTLPQMLQQAGYITAGFGKWHLGASFPTIDGQKPAGYGKFRADDNGANLDFSKPVYDGPVDHGFDHWLGFSCASECFVLNGKQIIGALQHDYYTTEAASDTDHLQLIPMDHYLPYITKASLRFLKGQKTEEEKKPFFLYFSPYVPHTPLAPSGRFKGITEAGEYGDYVHELDDAIGQILKTLDDLGLTEDTIVLFASDNGSAFQVSYKGIEDSDKLNRTGGHPVRIAEYIPKDSIDTFGKKAHYPNGRLKGRKQTAWEGGVRTPFIARWPGKFPAGTTNDELFALNDVMPTLAKIVAFELPEKAALDGYNLLPILKGKKKGERKSVVVQSSNNIFGLRMGKWKYIDAENHESEEATDELYDLSEDISESKNLIDSHPEVAKRMNETLKTIIDSTLSNANDHN